MAKVVKASVLRQRQNELTAGYFALAMLGLMAVFTIFHWMDLYLQRRSLEKDGPLTKKIITFGRSVRGLLLRKVPGFTSLGHAIVFVVYIAINITLSFYHLDWSVLNNWAKRLGWIATCNVALITFLALKNTPLAFLTAYSYERLNVLHQVAGYSTIIWSLCHAVVYLTAWSYSNSLDEMREKANVMGVVAALAMIVILASVLLLRKLRYEVFYVIHVVMFLLILISIGMHRPIIIKKVPAMVISAAGFWLIDRIIRGGRIILYAYGNDAVLTPLSHGGVRITMRRTPKRVVPGSHCFLWIPAIRTLETHPFTIVSTNPLELVVKAHDGFTKDLLHHAINNPGAKLRASIDGPYGKLPDFTNFDEAVLIAGGSGGSFTFGLALGLIDDINKGSSKAKRPFIKLIWVVQEYEQITWYKPELESLCCSTNVKVSIFITRSSYIPSTHLFSKAEPNGDTEVVQDLEKLPSMAIAPVSNSTSQVEKVAGTDFNEKAPTNSVQTMPASSTSSLPSSPVSMPNQPTNQAPTNLTVENIKPSIPDLIRAAVSDAAPFSRIVVAACGPPSMMQCTRKTVADLLSAKPGAAEAAPRKDVAIELCIEAFGW